MIFLNFWKWLLLNKFLLFNLQTADKVTTLDGVHFFTLTHPLQPYTIEIGSRNLIEMKEWLQLIHDTYEKIGLQVCFFFISYHFLLF